MTFLACLRLRSSKGDLFKASIAYCKARGWRNREQWYIAWQTTDLPAEVERAVKDYDPVLASVGA